MSKGPKQNGLILSTGHKNWKQGVGYIDIDDDILTINATNPRVGETSYLEMQMPLENIDDLIRALIEIKEQTKK